MILMLLNDFNGVYWVAHIVQSNGLELFCFIDLLSDQMLYQVAGVIHEPTVLARVALEMLDLTQGQIIKPKHCELTQEKYLEMLRVWHGKHKEQDWKELLLCALRQAEIEGLPT